MLIKKLKEMIETNYYIFSYSTDGNIIINIENNNNKVDLVVSIKTGAMVNIILIIFTVVIGILLIIL